MKSWKSGTFKQEWEKDLGQEIKIVTSALQEVLNAYLSKSSSVYAMLADEELLSENALSSSIENPGFWDFIRDTPLENNAKPIDSLPLEIRLLPDNFITILLQWSCHISWNDIERHCHQEVTQILQNRHAFSPEKNLIYSCNFNGWLKDKIQIELARRQEWYLTLLLSRYTRYFTTELSLEQANQIKDDGLTTKERLKHLGILQIHVPLNFLEIATAINLAHKSKCYIEAVWDKFKQKHEENNRTVYDYALLALSYHPEKFHTHNNMRFYKNSEGDLEKELLQIGSSDLQAVNRQKQKR